MSALHRWMNLAGVLLPFLGFVIAVVLLWNTLVDWSDLAVMLIMYVISGYGVTLGFHRLLTHRSFQTFKPVEYTLAILGSIAVQGPVISWVADHRKHHAHTDKEGDPHSPHGHGGGLRGAISGLWYAHMGWLFHVSGTSEHARYARDLHEDRGMRLIHSTFGLWVTVGILMPAALGYLLDADAGRRRDGGAVGRAGADLRAPPRDVVDQLGLPLLRDAPVRGRGPLDERVLAVAALVRRELAPQSPHVPALRASWSALVGGRSDGVDDPRHAAGTARLERRRDLARAPDREARPAATSLRTRVRGSDPLVRLAVQNGHKPAVPCYNPHGC